MATIDDVKIILTNRINLLLGLKDEAKNQGLLIDYDRYETEIEDVKKTLEKLG